jgi:cytoskeletal protein RodZ
MKRCPQCSFLYLDSDHLCDLDQTPLVADPSADVGAIEQLDHEPGKLSPKGSVRQRKLNLKTISAAIVAGLVIGLTMLLSYQRMRLEASQAPQASQAKTSQTQADQASRVTLVAQQASNEISTNAALAQQEPDTSASPDHRSQSAAPSSSTSSRTTLNTRHDSARVRVSSNPVSTGNVTKPGRGPVTIRLADGSTLQADEVWRTKAGIWYRRKGIVTLLKPNRVRSTEH